MFRSSLDTSIKPILCPRKSGPTHGFHTPPPAVEKMKGFASLAVLDGEWEWGIKLPNSPCDSGSVSLMRIKNGQVRAGFSHPAAGHFVLYGDVAMDGSVKMYAAGEHMQFSFIGTFGHCCPVN